MISSGLSGGGGKISEEEKRQKGEWERQKRGFVQGCRCVVRRSRNQYIERSKSTVDLTHVKSLLDVGLSHRV